MAVPGSSRWSTALLAPLTILAWLAVVLVAGWLLSHVTRALMTIVFSAVIAYALTPLVRRLNRFVPRAVAVAIAFLMGFAVVFGLLGIVVVTAATQVQTLVARLPAYASEARQLEPQVLGVVKPWGITITKEQLTSTETGLVHALQGAGEHLAGGAAGVIASTAGTILDTVLVLILSIYLTVNGPAIGRWLRREATPGAQRRTVTGMVLIVNQVVGGYVRGTLTMALLVGVLVGVGMAALRVNYAVLLGVLAFFMEFIPIVGVLVSGLLCVLIALFQGWILGLIVLGYFVIVHIIEGDVVGPRVMGRAIGIHPAVALVALVAGTELFGIWGALFGAPLAGLLQATATVLWTEYKQVQTPQAPASPAPSRVERSQPGGERSARRTR